MTTPQATVLAAICSLLSAVLVAWITGAFSRSEAELDRVREEAVERIRQEGATKSEEIRQLTAKIVEEAKSQGSIQIEQFKLQRDLILDAIGTTDREEAQKRLRFFAETGLIPDYAKKVLEFTEKKPINDIPVSVVSGPVRLPHWSGQYGEIAQAVVEIRQRDTAICAGLAIRPNAVLTMNHCVGEITPDKVLVTGEWQGEEKTVAVSTIEVLESRGAQKFSQDLVRLTLADSLDHFEEFDVRKPVVGEQVFILGRAPNSAIGFRGAVPISGFERFIVRCFIREVSNKDGFLSTNCPTSLGTSGSPIVAQKDLKILSLVAWGRSNEETNGPLLFDIRARFLE